MIASLTGTIVASGKDFVVLRIGGVGLHVSVPQTLLNGPSSQGQEMTLFTHLHVRENELALYGFGSEQELKLFRLLLGVSGVGPKVGLTILSSLPPVQLQEAIAREDVTALARVPGIGPKTARKLVFDLKDKVAVDLAPGAPEPVLTDQDAELVAALTGLGYSVAEAREAVAALPRDPLPLEERVRLALAYFVS